MPKGSMRLKVIREKTISQTSSSPTQKRLVPLLSSPVDRNYLDDLSLPSNKVSPYEEPGMQGASEQDGQALLLIIGIRRWDRVYSGGLFRYFCCWCRRRMLTRVGCSQRFRKHKLLWPDLPGGQAAGAARKKRKQN